jgi:hypothetical protein
LDPAKARVREKLQERGTRVRKLVREEVCDWVLKEVRCLLSGAYRKEDLITLFLLSALPL